MHFSLLSSILVSTLAVGGGMAKPVASSNPLANSLSNITWTGEVVPGQGTITLNGSSLKDVYDQVLAINPEYRNDDKGLHFDEPGMITSGKDEQPVPTLPGHGVNATYQCAGYATANKKDIPGQAKWLMNLAGKIYLPPSMCARVSCYHDSSVYVCNDDATHGVDPDLAAAGLYAYRIYYECCHKSHGLAGHVHNYSNGPGMMAPGAFRVVVGFGHCDKPEAGDRPDQYTDIPGRMGECDL